MSTSGKPDAAAPTPTAPTPAATTPAAPTGPIITTTEVTWRGERLFDAGPAGRTHRIDGSAKLAPGPVETLLNAVATCSALDVIDIIAKRKALVERMTINVSSERRTEYPRRIQTLRLEFHIDGAGIEREHAERAIQLSYERYCSAAASLAPDIVTETVLVLNGERADAVRQKVWTAGSTK